MRIIIKIPISISFLERLLNISILFFFIISILPSYHTKKSYKSIKLIPYVINPDWAIFTLFIAYHLLRKRKFFRNLFNIKPCFFRDISFPLLHIYIWKVKMCALTFTKKITLEVKNDRNWEEWQFGTYPKHWK